MAEWLRVFAILVEGLGLIPNSHVRPFTATLNSSTRGFGAS